MENTSQDLWINCVGNADRCLWGQPDVGCFTGADSRPENCGVYFPSITCCISPHNNVSHLIESDPIELQNKINVLEFQNCYFQKQINFLKTYISTLAIGQNITFDEILYDINDQTFKNLLKLKSNDYANFRVTCGC